MNREQVNQAMSAFLTNFNSLSREEKLDFLNFNQRHHHRKINEILSIYMQNPEATLLGSFQYWKDLSTESSVAFGQKANVRLWDEQGRVRETLYDITQTTLHDPFRIQDTIVDERVLVNTIGELTGQDYLLGDFNLDEYNTSLSQFMQAYIEQTVKTLPQYTDEQKDLALHIAKYNLLEEFGAFLEEDRYYQEIAQTVLNRFEEISDQGNLLRSFALANNFSQEFSRQVIQNYEAVSKKTLEKLDQQKQLNEQLKAIETQGAFEEAPVVEQENSTLLTTDPQLLFEQAILKLNLGNTFKVDIEPTGDVRLVRDSLSGILIEPVVTTDGKDFSFSDIADSLTGVKDFKREFYQVLDQEYETKKMASEEVAKEVNIEAQAALEESPVISEAETVWDDQTLLEEVFKYGSGFAQGKERLQYYFSEHELALSKTNAIAFLKDECGIGGRGDGTFDFMHDSKGITIWQPVERKISWSQAVDYLSEAVANDVYLSSKDKLKYEEWKSDPKNIDYAQARWQEEVLSSEKEQQTEISLFDFENDTIETVIPESEPLNNVLNNEKHSEIITRHVDEAINSSDLEQTPSISEPLLDYSFPDESIYSLKIADKVKDNLKALALLKHLNSDQRKATAPEQEILARYVGWGGLANTFFDESNPRFKEERQQLRELVTTDEYHHMRKFSLTAYYTDPQIITALYQQLEALGFKGGRMLDPSMGSGNFFSALPEDLKAKTERYGVELDPLSGALSQQLHQGTHIQVTGFEKTNFAKGSMDVVTTNVPFGSLMIADERYEANYAIHDYFIKKSLDLVREGGLVAVITSTFTMDKQNDSFRKELASTANLVGAVRLPDTAFKAIAGTNVSSDLLIFQKTSTPELSPEWLKTDRQSDAFGNTISVNHYFTNHPDKVLGTIKIKTFNGGTLSVENKGTPAEMIEQLHKALNFQLTADVTSLAVSDHVFEEVITTQKEIPKEVLNRITPFTFYVHDKQPYYHNGNSVELYQKTSSLTLNANETRKNQLERYTRNQDKIVSEKEKFKLIYQGKGYFDSWDNFIPTTSEAKNQLPEIDPVVLKTIAQEDEATQKGFRYTFDPHTSELKIEQLISTQYFYHVPYQAKEVQAIEAMIDLRISLQEVLNVQHQPDFETAYEPLRIALNQKYDRFVEQFGAISSPANHSLMKQDDYYQFLASIEEEVEDSLTKETRFVKGAVFREPTIQVEKGVVEVSTASDALLASLNHKGKLDFDYMQDIYGKEKEAIIDELGQKIFYLGAGEYQTREDYLSGDVKTKLEIAQTNQEFNLEGINWQSNIEALEAVIPKDLALSDIAFKFGSRFIPNHIYQAFLAGVLDQKVRGGSKPDPQMVTIDYDNMNDVYRVELDQTYNFAVTNTYAYQNRSKNQIYLADKLATTLLNQRSPKIYQPDPNDPSGKKRIVDSEATASIQEKGMQLTNQFQEWVMKTPDAQAEIVKIYNQRYNRSVMKHYQGEGLTINGLAKQFQLRPHQADAVMRIVQERRAGLAHEVGSGKTLTMLASSMKLQELGIINKPLFVIPKPLIDQFAREIYKYFPESKVLVATSKDFAKENRKRFISRIANGSYNAIVIADSQFGKVAMSKAYQNYYMTNEIEQARQMLENMDSDRKYTVKRIEKKIEGLEKRLEDLQKKETDTFINFEELGVDFLYVDEAHNFKNLAPYTQLENVKGVSDTRSQKAMDLMMKVEYLHQQYDNRHVVLSTGTPMSNSVVELYTMMKYVEPDVLARYGMTNFDTWVAHFGQIEDNFELTAAGTFKINRRFTQFGNVPELMNMFKESWDIQTSEMLDLPVPEAKTVPHYSQATTTQSNYIDELTERATQIENGEVKPYEDNMLKIVGENRKLTLDMRTLDSQRYTAMDSDKLNQLVTNVVQIYQENNDSKATQMIFSDLSVPFKYRNSPSYNHDGSVNTFSAYDEIKRLLVEKGIPDHEIRFIHEATDKNKEAMMREMRTGQIRVLLGSTGKAGTGLNVQDKLIAVHHLDVPWRPSDITQRNGRIIRQGNENKEVQIHHYITKGSMDAFLWQTQEIKAHLIEQIMSGKSTARTMEELNMETPGPSLFKANATGNPLQAEFMKLEMELVVLERSRNRYYEGKATDQKRVGTEKDRLASFEKRLFAIQKDLEAIEGTKEHPFALDLTYQGETKHFNSEDKKSEVGAFFAKRLNGNVMSYQMHVGEQSNTLSIGHYRGFELLHNLGASLETTETLILKGQAQYSVRVDTSAPTGILTRLDNKIDDGIAQDYENTLLEIDRLSRGIEKIESAENQPYPREEEYFEKRERHATLKAELEEERNMNLRDVSNDYESSSDGMEM